MRRQLLIISFLLLLLPSCRSHKNTVIRPSANAEYRQPQPKAGNRDAVRSTGKANAKTGETRSLDVDPRVGSELVSAARRWLGTPYRYGGETPKGTDCSGMVMAVYRDVAGVKLPRSSAAQAEFCLNIPRQGLQPGDLVFFSSSRGGNRISHVGLYVGGGKIIHSSTSRGVIESDLAEKYYDAHYHSSGRVYAVTLASTGGKKKAKAQAQSETSEISGFSEHSASPELSGQPKPSKPAVGAAVAQADSVRRAGEIRRDVTKAMRFGK